MLDAVVITHIASVDKRAASTSHTPTSELFQLHIHIKMAALGGHYT